MSTEGRSSQEGVVGVFSRAASTYDSHGPRFFSQLGQRLVEVSHVMPGASVLDTGRCTYLSDIRCGTYHNRMSLSIISS